MNRRATREARPEIASRAISSSLFTNDYDRLRRIASSLLRGERTGHTLQPTALVHEAFVRILSQRTAGWDEDGALGGIVVGVMRRVLIDSARRHSKRRCRMESERRERNSREAKGSPFDPEPFQRMARRIEVARLIQDLEEIDTRKSHIVRLRFFFGLSMPEVARALEIPLRTVERDWSVVRAWLRARLSG